MIIHSDATNATSMLLALQARGVRVIVVSDGTDCTATVDRLLDLDERYEAITNIAWPTPSIEYVREKRPPPDYPPYRYARLTCARILRRERHPLRQPGRLEARRHARKRFVQALHT